MIWLIGAGPMAIDYFNVLIELNKDLTVIGRSKKSAKQFEALTGKPVIIGGIEAFLKTQPKRPSSVIISTSVEQLATTALVLMKYGVKNILIEKPGGISSKEIKTVANMAKTTDSSIFVAYNRRYYASVQKAQEMIEVDGGVISFNFEITEWSHVIQNHQKDLRTMHSWFLGNTTHVIDTAFFLGGNPTKLCTFKNGSLEWHPASSNFSGAGITDKDALFSYSGNWKGPGRWSLDVISKKRRYIFRPFEQLHTQQIGSIAINKVEIDSGREKELKPGLYLQCESFLNGNTSNMCTIEAQVALSKIYEEMAGYHQT